jgi:hypothetical protein
MARGPQTGRIRPDQRDTDDTVPIIGADIAIDEEHDAAVQDTESKGMKPRTRNEHRNRQRHIMDWWRNKYPSYFEDGTVALSEEDRNDPTKYYHTNRRDLRYAGLNVRMVKAFLVSKKIKSNGNYITPSDLSKYGDSIKWGAKIAGERLPQQFYVEFETFIASYKKEYAEAKKEGKVDEKAADPVNASLFTLILKWALEEMNIFVWVYSLLMWHLMARSISVSSLAFHNMKRGTASDSIAFKYDDSKTDQTGEFVQEKNCYANPKKARLCLYLALGCWISINSESFEARETLFVKSNTKPGAAAQNYCRQLVVLVKRHASEACDYLRLSRFHAHGIRKGSGTHASSATTVPPQFTSVAARGEWSMGKILDIYFQFAMGGDYYLGRLLSLIPPEDKMFGSLPPHWKDEKHDKVKEALHITFGKALSSHEEDANNPKGVMLFLLASMVHHSDWLLKEMNKNPQHPFSNIPLLHKPDLLKELKEEHLTLEPTETMEKASGIPPFVKHNQLLVKVMELCILNSDSIKEFKDELKDAVAEAIDAKVTAEGGVNRATMVVELEKMTEVLRGELKACLRDNDTLGGGQSAEVGSTLCKPRPDQFHYTDGGRSRATCIPDDFAFPLGTKRYDGWRKWLCGQVYEHEGVRWQLPPFRHIRGVDLNKVNRQVFHSDWKPIFSKMMEAPGVLPVPDIVTEEYIRSSFDNATQFLKDNYSYIFTKSDDMVSLYTIGTWSKKIKPSEVLKYGSEEDKQKLQPTAVNKKRTRKEGTSESVTRRKKRRNQVNKVS